MTTLIEKRDAIEQEKQFLQFSEHAKNEIDAVTSNHGTKFLRNTAICLILATIELSEFKEMKFRENRDIRSIIADAY